MTLRERPYSAFNFLVNFGPDVDSVQAGFQEVSGLGLEITLIDYRNGNEKVNAPRKVTGMFKVPEVTLKRGVIGDDTLYQWLDAVRNGSQDSLRTVTITLLSEDRVTTAQRWVLTNARPSKYTGPPLSGKSTDVAVEEVSLGCESIQMEFP